VDGWIGSNEYEIRKRYKKTVGMLEDWAAKHAGMMNRIMQYKDEC
jgi:hypothetical protein